jgi:hypothetical protein
MSANGGEEPPPADEEPPPAGGVFRRFAPGAGGFGNALGAVEEIFAPARHEARIQLEEQKRVGKLAPAPGDPPDLAEPEPARSARPGQRFKGTVKIPRPSS